MGSPSRTGRSLAWAVPIAAEAGAFARSIIFAWAIGPDDLGRAMMLALTVRLAEMASDVGIDRLIVQARDGNTARLQSGLHAAAILRGVVSALVVLALSPALAAFFAGGPSVASYAGLSVIPLIRGFAHLDYRRAERRFSYAGMAITEGGATLAMVACILPATWAFGDYRAMTAVLIAHAVALTGMSHAVATRPYRVRLLASVLKRSWRFGGPLILNALLLFTTFYADRVIVARAYDWTSLAVYGVALQLALLPAQIVGRAAASLLLPVLRQAIAAGAAQTALNRLLFSYAGLGAGLALGFTLLAPPVIPLVYGAEFRPGLSFALALGLAAGFRVLRTPLSQFAIATGRTADPARANLIRAFAVVPAALCAAAGLPLWTVAAAAAAGEGGATLRAYQLVNKTVNNRFPKESLA